MKPFLYVFISLILGAFNAFSQNCVPVSKNTEKLSLQKETLLFIDSTSLLTLKKARNADFQPLTEITIPKLLFEQYQYNYFLNFCLYNPSLDTVSLLYTAGEFWKQEALIKSRNNSELSIKAFQTHLEKERAYPFDHKYIPLKLVPRDTLNVMVKIKDLTGKTFELKPQIISYNTDAKDRLKALYQDKPVIFLNTAFYAMLLTMVFVAFSLFYFSQKRYMIYFGLYVLFLLGYNVYGFSYSSYTITLIDYFPILKFQLRQTFYILCAQLALVSFVSGFINIKTDGTPRQKMFFKFLMIVFSSELIIELLICLVFKRYDWELYNAKIVELSVSILGLAMLINIFKWKNLAISVLFKIGGACLFFAAVYGFLSAAMGWNNSSSIIFLYYPNFTFLFFVLMALLFFLSAIIERFFQNFTEQGRLQKQYAMSELSLLRSQINPHFLFNTLNSIKSAIYTKSPNDASQYLTDFSDLVRSILEKSREHIVTLKEEIEITEQYIQLEQRRFENPFTYFIDKELNLDFEKINVPAFLLQPFVENAIKHGFQNIQHQGLIRISIFSQKGTLKISIEDNGIGRNAAVDQKKWLKPHLSMGQQLITDRINLLNDIYAWGIEFRIEDLQEPSGTKVILDIPKMN